MDLETHLKRQKTWSEKSFGPYTRPLRTEGVIDHIEKELIEVKDAPRDLEEWVDMVILSLEGAMCAGYTPREVVRGIEAKTDKNEGRSYPDWRTLEPGTAIEHIRTPEEQAAKDYEARNRAERAKHGES